MILFIFVVSCTAALAAGKTSLGVAGGTQAALGEFPYIVNIRNNINDANVTYIPFCGGSIITKSWFVFTGQCAEVLRKDDDIEVHAGMIDLNDPNSQITKIVNFTIHPDYLNGIKWKVGDIAVAKVDPPFEFGELVQPIKLPKPGTEPDTLRNATVAGWGRLNDAGDYGDLLQKTEVPFLDFYAGRKNCQKLIEESFSYSHIDYNNTELCTGPIEGGYGPCGGDYGGPLVQDGYLVGVASFQAGSCGMEETIAAYPKVSAFVNWIQETIDEDLLFS